MRQSQAGPFRLLRRLGALLLTLGAILSLELLAITGHDGPNPILLLGTVSVVAAILGGIDVGLASTFISVFYCLHYNNEPGQSQLLKPSSMTHLVELLSNMAIAVLVMDLLRRRRLAQRHEQQLRAEAEAARINQERFQAALRTAPITVFNQDRDLRYTWVHVSSGVPHGHLLGKIDEEIFPDGHGSGELAAIKRWVLETGAGVRQEITVPIHGQPHTFDLTLQPLRDCDDRIVGITGAAIDLTGHKHTAEALLESEAMLARAQQVASIGSWEIQLASGRVLCSDQAYRILGLTPIQVHEGYSAVLARMHPEDQPLLVRQMRLTATEGTPCCVELRILRSDGTVRTVLAQAERICDDEGKPVRLTGTMLDITKRKQAEQQLQALNETLEQRVAERTAEAEQRTAQLRTLASELTLAEQRERRRLAQILHDHLQQLLVGAKFSTVALRNRLSDPEVLGSLRTISDLLDQSVSVSRSLTVEISPPVLYDGGLSVALHWLASWMQEKYNLSVDVQADNRADPEGEDIRVLLFQAVRELLFNIVKHAGVRQARLEADLADGDLIRIRVIDEGAGFDPTRHSMNGGYASGFGLLSIRERLEILGGKMEIDSAPGHGTRTTLLAPLLPPAKSQTEQRPGVLAGVHVQPEVPDDRLAEAGRIRVLLADDHKIVREGLVRLLQLYPEIHVVGEAADGAIAVELARRTHPNVILMDVTMPNMNGVEATRRIMAEMPYVRVIGLSMHTEKDMSERLREAGAVGYLSKSTDPETVIEAIRAASPANSSSDPEPAKASN